MKSANSGKNVHHRVFEICQDVYSSGKTITNAEIMAILKIEFNNLSKQTIKVAHWEFKKQLKEVDYNSKLPYIQPDIKDFSYRTFSEEPEMACVNETPKAYTGDVEANWRKRARRRLSKIINCLRRK